MRAIKIWLLFAVLAVSGCSSYTLSSPVADTKQAILAEKCLPPKIRLTLAAIRREFGPITIISTHRKGAKIKGSGQYSMHHYCRAVDFKAPKGKYQVVVKWLEARGFGQPGKPLGLGTYSGRFNHIHIDNNGYRWHN